MCLTKWITRISLYEILFGADISILPIKIQKIIEKIIQQYMYEHIQWEEN